MDKELVVANLKTHEGFRSHTYICSLGYATIGYGTLISVLKAHKEAISRLKNTIITDSSIWEIELTTKEADILLRLELDLELNEFKDEYIYFNNLLQNYQCLLADMCYQLKASGVLEFKNMLKGMEEKNDLKVIKNMKDSKWYKQTPNRVKSLINLYILKWEQPIMDRSQECDSCQ